VESVYLKTLVEVVRTGSLSRAADVLCITQPAVSRRIKVLEEQYGHPLLDRSGHVLRPTGAGRVVCEKAERLLELEADLVADLHLLSGRTRISFCSTPSFGIAHLPSILKEFMLTRVETADLEFAVNVPQDILRGLNEGLYDVAVMEMCDCFDLSAFRVFPLPDAETVFVSAPSLAIPTETDIDTLSQLPFFVRREGCCSRTLLENGLEGIGHGLREFRKLIVVDDLHMIVRAVIDGEGVAFVSPDVVGDAVATGRLTTHKIPGFQHSRQRALVINQTISGDGPAAAFVRAVFGHFKLSIPPGVGSGAAAPTPSTAETTAGVSCTAAGGDGSADRSATRPPRSRKPARRASR
jgi:LysR family transcriptional regulator, transcriptional activator of the cysJI operon